MYLHYSWYFVHELVNPQDADTLGMSLTEFLIVYCSKQVLKGAGQWGGFESHSDEYPLKGP
jgi:hypothetical protein